VDPNPAVPRVDELPWIDVERNDPVLRFVSPLRASDPTNPMFDRGPFFLDPLAIHAGFTSANMFIVTPSDPSVVPFRYISLYDPMTNGPMLPGLTRRMFRGSDDLQFTVETDQLGNDIAGPDKPPSQIFDLSNGQPMRRQSRGEMSWSAILVPEKGSAWVDANNYSRNWHYRIHVLVYKNRNLADPSNQVFWNTDRDPRWPVELIHTNTINPFYSGGTVYLDNMPNIEIGKGEWVMMVNRDLNKEVGFQHQVGFFRVIGSDPTTYSLTLDGPDFAFNSGNGVLPDTHTRTFIVHLPGVVEVYDRVLEFESDSAWN
jgi:hypothetical protein